MSLLNHRSEAWQRQPRWHGVTYLLLLLAGGVWFAVMNWLTPFKEDDMAFTLIEDVWTPIGGLLDLLRSHANHYLHANGRTANLVASLFCALLGKTAFNICNTLMFCALTHLVSLLATGRRSLLAVAIFYTYVGCSYPVPGETMLWLTGSCNYLWAVTLSLWLVWLLLRRWGDGMNALQGVALLVLALVAGSFNEATSFGIFAGWCAYYVFNRRCFDKRAAIVLVGYAVGIAVIVASPGAWQRAADGGIAIDVPFKQLMASRFYIFDEKVWRFITPVSALVIGVGYLLFRGWRALVSSVWTYLFLALAVVMLALGITHERAYAALATVALIITIMAVVHVLRRLPAWASAVVLAAGLLMWGYSWARATRVLWQYKAYDDQITEQIAQSGRQCVLLEREFDGYSRFVKTVCYQSTGYFTHEQAFCGYYDKDNVQFVPRAVLERYQAGTLLTDTVRSSWASVNPSMTTAVLDVPGQDYMIVLPATGRYCRTMQQARYYRASTDTLGAKELQRRERYALVQDYTPRGFYPLVQDGHTLLIFPRADEGVSHVVYSMGDAVEDTLACGGILMPQN